MCAIVSNNLVVKFLLNLLLRLTNYIHYQWIYEHVNVLTLLLDGPSINASKIVPHAPAPVGELSNMPIVLLHAFTCDSAPMFRLMAMLSCFIDGIGRADRNMT